MSTFPGDKLTLLVVGESPSPADPEGVLADYQSGRRLEAWLKETGAYSLYEIKKVNAFLGTGRPAFNDYRVAANRLKKYLFKADVILALGGRASKVVVMVRGDYVSLPHPPGRNRQLNDKDGMKTRLSNLAHELRSRYYLLRGRYEG